MLNHCLREAKPTIHECHEKDEFNILRVTEVRWPGTVQISIDKYTMYYTGNKEPHHYKKLAIIVDQRINRTVENIIPLSDMLQIKDHPRDINIIQVYAPTTTYCGRFQCQSLQRKNRSCG